MGFKTLGRDFKVTFIQNRGDKGLRSRCVCFHSKEQPIHSLSRELEPQSFHKHIAWRSPGHILPCRYPSLRHDKLGAGPQEPRRPDPKKKIEIKNRKKNNRHVALHLNLRIMFTCLTSLSITKARTSKKACPFLKRLITDFTNKNSNFYARDNFR